jgi:hypothetical protein
MTFLRWLGNLITYPLRALLSAPSRLLSGSRRLWGISLPARMAILVGIFLVICVVVTLVIFYNTQDRSFVKAKLTLTFILVIAALVIAIPIVLYKALQLWLESDISPFPDIDLAWKAGVAELERHGLDLGQIPLFLILGSAGEKQGKSLFDASQMSFNVREIPQGPAALHWYANATGIYIVCTNTGCLSKISGIARDAFEKEQSQPSPAQPRPRAGADKLRGTIVAGGESDPKATGAASGILPRDLALEQPAPSSSIRGTMIIGGSGAAAASFESEDAAPMEKKVIKLEQQAAAEQERRLEYLCRLIRRARQPLCPLNGILTLLPFGLIERSVPEALEVQRSVKRDLAVVSKVLMVRCPATAVLVGLEEENGFRELIRRVGRDRAAGQRFGKGFSLGNPPTPERLEPLCAHACGAFEDWVYVLFREKGSLSKPGNTKLYALLCKIRRTIQSRLANILVAGYGFAPGPDQPGESLLFGGCYFAAAGESEERQAFVKGVFDKLLDQQEELEWTDSAYRQDQGYHHLAQIALVVDTALVLGLAALIFHKWLHLW